MAAKAFSIFSFRVDIIDAQINILIN